MDNLNTQAGESQLRLHDSCFDKCVQNLSVARLDSSEETCIKGCFKSFAHTFKNGSNAISAHYDTVRAHQRQ